MLFQIDFEYGKLFQPLRYRHVQTVQETVYRSRSTIPVAINHTSHLAACYIASVVIIVQKLLHILRASPKHPNNYEIPLDD